MKRSLQVGRVAVLAAGASIVALAGAEVAVRLLGLADKLVSDPAFESSDRPGVGYQYKRNFRGRVHGETLLLTNRQGLRDREYSLKKSVGRMRVVVMGDSVVFGQGVACREVFTELLEESLTATLCRPVDVVNFGVQGYTLDNEVSRFATDAIQYQPDVAILAPISDDLNLSRSVNFVDSEGYLTKTGSVPAVLKTALRSSHLAYLVKDAYGKRSAPEPFGTDAPERREALLRLEREVQRFLEACRQSDVVPFIVLLDLQETPLTQAIATLMRSRFREVRFIDVSPRFGANGWDRFGIRGDGHPGPLAHRLYAEALQGPILDTLTTIAAAEGSVASHCPAEGG